MQQSKRKPFNNDAGYKASRRFKWGWSVIYDRQNGGDWIDADTRWVVAAYNNDMQNIGLQEARTRADAYTIMKFYKENAPIEFLQEIGEV